MLGDPDEADSRLPGGAWSEVVQSWMIAARFPTGTALALMPFSLTIR